MTVTINAVPAKGSPLPNPSSFVLAPGGLSSPNGFDIQTSRNVQVRQFLRGTAAAPADRGNIHTTVTFSVTRIFTTVALAEAFILLHASTIPGGGTITFVALDSSTYYLQNAVVRTTSSKQTGRTTIHSYSIEGGVISRTNLPS